VEETVFAGERTLTFFCGDLEGDPKPCAVCGAEDAPWLCDWPVARQVELPVAEVKIGDIWITQQAGKRARVVEIEEFTIGPIARRFWLAIPGHKKPYPYIYMRYLSPGVTATIERSGFTCDEACCDRCVRELDDEVHYCQAHWNSWEAT
jgi:hypothetical protein